MVQSNDEKGDKVSLLSASVYALNQAVFAKLDQGWFAGVSVFGNHDGTGHPDFSGPIRSEDPDIYIMAGPLQSSYAAVEFVRSLADQMADHKIIQRVKNMGFSHGEMKEVDRDLIYFIDPIRLGGGHLCADSLSRLMLSVLRACLEHNMSRWFEICKGYRQNPALKETHNDGFYREISDVDLAGYIIDFKFKPKGQKINENVSPTKNSSGDFNSDDFVSRQEVSGMYFAVSETFNVSSFSLWGVNWEMYGMRSILNPGRLADRIDDDFVAMLKAARTHITRMS